MASTDLWDGFYDIWGSDGPDKTMSLHNICFISAVCEIEKHSVLGRLISQDDVLLHNPGNASCSGLDLCRELEAGEKV